MSNLVRFATGRVVPSRWLASAMVAAALLVTPAAAARAERALAQTTRDSPVRPNILWLTSEDNGPHLGAYGDDYADTPNLDDLASRGLIYRNAWSTAPVCAPARTTVISGLYPTSTGSQHMRSMARLPAGFKMFPQYLREAGYYTTNNAKEDYNLEKPGQVWDDSSTAAHWRNRPRDAPFFAVFNFGVSHESQIRRRPHRAVHDPALVRLPAYHPDTPEVRRDWAQYYDKLTEMDAQVGQRLRELEEDGLVNETIVVYWGDHGVGLPRSKRTPLDTGLRVPLIVSIPPKLRHLAPAANPGGTTERLVGFIDLAPTMLSLAGIQPPDYLQGSAFLGPYEGPVQPYLYGFRDRMDERYDLVRSIRDERFLYLRNYMPHRAHGQHVAYLFQTPTTRVWYRLFEEGRLPPEQASFWLPRSTEELYDLDADPDQVANLASSAERADTLIRLRTKLREHLLETRDLGFLPEAEIHSRSAESGVVPWEYGHSSAYRLEEILAVAELASDRQRQRETDRSLLLVALKDADSAVRAWAAQGLLIRGAAAVNASRSELREALDDDALAVRVHAAEALGRHGGSADLQTALDCLIEAASLERHDLFDVTLALNAIDYLDHRALSHRAQIFALPKSQPDTSPRTSFYVAALIEKTLQDLDTTSAAHGEP